jgi:plastocyanin
VTWTNRMSARHTVTADNGEFDSGQLARDQSFSHTFTAAGAVPYHCEIHPFMTGQVTVT